MTWHRLLSSLAVRIAAVLAILPLPLAALAQPAVQPATPTDTASCAPAQPYLSVRGAAIWDAQPQLISKCLALIPARAADHPNVYTVAISPHGTQNLFSREARLALQKLGANYGGTAQRGVLLSNAPVDYTLVPFATTENMTQVFSAIGQRTYASPDDVLIVYLVSHGSPDAALQSALPGNIPILAVSADSLAIALERARVKRRVIIISACFSGSWIPRLATDDTIIMAAAAADRTSFGCAEDRPLTYFGDALLNGPLSRGASLAESFEGAKTTVTRWERDEKLLNSEPQYFVGRNMESFWRALAPNAAPAPVPAPQPAAAKRIAGARKSAAK
ncbi:MAG TPA: C13 family peptidase [Sphingobium sp.]